LACHLPPKGATPRKRPPRSAAPAPRPACHAPVCRRPSLLLALPLAPAARGFKSKHERACHDRASFCLSPPGGALDSAALALRLFGHAPLPLAHGSSGGSGAARRRACPAPQASPAARPPRLRPRPWPPRRRCCRPAAAGLRRARRHAWGVERGAAEQPAQLAVVMNGNASVRSADSATSTARQSHAPPTSQDAPQ